MLTPRTPGSAAAAPGEASAPRDTRRAATSAGLFIAYLAAFFGAWIAYVVLVYPSLVTLGTTTLTYAVANLAIRSTIWVLPVVLYVRLVDGRDPVSYLRLNCHVVRGIVVGLFAALLLFVADVVAMGPPHVRPEDVAWNSIFGTSLLVGVIEEIPFRGFILQKLGERYPPATATMLSSVLFLGIHLPGWLLLDIWSLHVALFVFMMGFVLAALFLATRSLWSPIVLHSLNDCFSSLLFHAT